MNPDSDATAIWLERKFDVPDSGKWVSETVFSMPLVPRKVAQASDFPGLIVFECTPLEGVTDDIERFAAILFAFISECLYWPQGNIASSTIVLACVI